MTVSLYDVLTAAVGTSAGFLLTGEKRSADAYL